MMRRTLRAMDSGPTFIGIGAHKAGTTWLFSMLAQHPEIGFGHSDEPGLAEKERHFWCRPLHGGRNSTVPVEGWPTGEALEGYLASFGQAPVRGEITPHYALLPDETIARLVDALAGVRVVYLVRDPRRRAWSHAFARLMEERGEAPEREVRSWDGAGATQFSDDDVAFMVEILRRRPAQAYSDYGAVIERWRRLLPEPEALLVVRSDGGDRRDTLRTVLTHIDAAPGFADTATEKSLTERVNPHRPASLEIPEQVQRVLDKIYRPFVDRFEEVTGMSVEGWRDSVSPPGGGSTPKGGGGRQG
jgi:hypothetical protein